MKKNLLIRYLTIFMVLMSFNSTALYAGLVKVKCDAGTKVTIVVHYNPPDTAITQAKTDANNDGEVEFGIGNQSAVRYVFVIKISDGAYTLL